MQLASSGRVVFIAQWVLAVLLPMFVFLGRGLVGAELGWMAVIGFVYGWVIILALLLPPVVTLFDREARVARSAREWYAIAMAVVWLALLVVGVTIPDSGDAGHLTTALSAWTGVTDEVSFAVFNAALGLALLAWVASIIVAVLGIIRSRTP